MCSHTVVITVFQLMSTKIHMKTSTLIIYSHIVSKPDKLKVLHNLISASLSYFNDQLTHFAGPDVVAVGVAAATPAPAETNVPS